MQEINLNLKHIEPSGSWGRRFKNSSLFNIATSNAHTTSTERRLFGGTALLATPYTTARITDHGHDPTGLGRWSWLRIRGRQGITTRIITGYRPVRDHTNRPGTVFSQQEKYFWEQRHPRDPRLAFLEDLGGDIRASLHNGEQIVLGLDINEYILSGDIAGWINGLGLIPILHQHHPQLPEVATCDKGNRQIPIDGIWISPGIDVLCCGMTGFGEFPIGTSDHRMLWIEITLDSVFGYNPTKLATITRDIFSVRDPLSIRRYNNYVRRQRNYHRLPEKLVQLELKAEMGNFTIDDEALYNRLCVLDDGIRRQAKKQARPFYAGQVLYSDVIGLDYHEIRLWQLVIKRKSGRRTDTRHIRRLMHRTNQMTALQLSLEQAKAAQAQCISRYRRHKKDQHRLRDNFERKQDERIADSKGISLAAQQKSRRTARQVRAKFSAIRDIISTKTRVPLYAAEYVNERGDIIECLQKDDIEQACQREGQRRFQQASNTPFMQGSLVRDLGFLGTQTTVDAILQGEYQCDDDIDLYTNLFIQELRIPPAIADLPIITGTATIDEHTAAWKRMKPYTASSPYGPLFSDYIVGTHCRTVAAIDNLFAKIPIKACFCPTTWVKAVDVMIPKKQSSLNVDKLRIIVLFHAMFNLINKRVGRRMVQRAHDFQQIPLEAFGSVPYRQANVCALNKALVNDVLRQQRRPAALCSNDATSCYDRIVHVVASLCMQRLGVDAHTCRVLFGTLQHLQHHVSTAYGVSSQPYGGVQIPLQGVGQGNGAGPAIWLVMTIPLINMLRRQGFGFKSISPITKHSCHLACFTYVDDTDTIHAPVNEGTTTGQVLQEIQEAINVWAGGLHATGGTLSPEKSYWYFLDFYWHQPTLSWKYKNISKLPGTLTFPVGQNRVRISRHEPSKAVETLGIPLAMDGNQDAIFDSLKSKIEKWASKIQTGQLSARETFISLQSGIAKSVEYPLVATRLTKAQCNALLRPLRRAALPALGIPTTFPTILVHTPKDYLGLDFPNLWFEQCFSQIGCFLQHSGDTNNDSTAQLLTHVIEGMRVEMGVLAHPLSYSYYKMHLCTTTTQLHPAWQFCTDSGLSFRDNTIPWHLPRQHDQCLMDFFLESGFSAKELKMLNVCRLFLQVIYISDFSTGDGLYVDSTSLGRRSPFQHHSHIRWPPAGPPSKNCWILWDNALRTLIHSTNRIPIYRLKQPLGFWRYIPPGWRHFLDPGTGNLYSRTDTANFLCATPQANPYGTRSASYRAQSDNHSLPLQSIPTTIRTRGTTWYHSGITSFQPPPDPSLTSWWGTVIHRPLHLHHIIDGIRNGTAILVTDGSFKDGLGTAAFTLRSDLHALEGLDVVNMTPGWDADIDPYRAELAGIYGCLRLINLLSTQFHISHGNVTLACDCVSALTRLQQCRPLRPSSPHFDLLHACRTELHRSPIKWTFLHVRGHQDNHRRYELLDRYSQLNVDMDSLAKSYWHTLNANRPPPYSLPPEHDNWSLWQGEHRLTSWDRPTAQHCFYNRSIQAYWQQRRGEHSLQNVSWEACGMALRRVTTTQQLWIPRWLTSFIPTGNRVQFFNSAQSNLCPRCQQPETHRHHVIRCPYPATQVLWHQRLLQLESWMILHHTKPTLRSAILDLLRCWYSEQPWIPPVTNDASDTTVFIAQQQAGVAQFIDGFIVNEWAECQHQYYLWLQRRTTGKRWLARLIQQIWEIAWDLWRHRHKVLHSPTSLALSHLHTELDEKILTLYRTYTPDTPLHLARWFARPYPTLTAESIDFKRQWLEILEALTTPA